MTELLQSGQVWQPGQALPGIMTVHGGSVQPKAFKPLQNPGPHQIYMELADQFARQKSTYTLHDIALKCTSLWMTCLYTTRPVAQQRFIHSTIGALNHPNWVWKPPSDINCHSTRPLRRQMKDFIAITAFCAYIMTLMPRTWVPHSAEMRLPFLKASKAMTECYVALNKDYSDCTELVSSIWSTTLASNLSGDLEEWPRIDAEMKMVKFRDEMDKGNKVGREYIPLESAQLSSVFWVTYFETMISRAFPTPSYNLKTFHQFCKDSPFTDPEWMGTNGDSRRDRIRANPIMEGLLHRLFHRTRLMWEKSMELIDEIRVLPVMPMRPRKRFFKKAKAPETYYQDVDNDTLSRLRDKYHALSDYAEKGPMMSEFYNGVTDAQTVPENWHVSRDRMMRAVHAMRADFHYLSLLLLHECCIRELHEVVDIKDTHQSMADMKIHLAVNFLDDLKAASAPMYQLQGPAAAERVRVVCSFMHQVQLYNIPKETELSALRAMEGAMLQLYSMDMKLAREFLRFVHAHGYKMDFGRIDENGKIILEEIEDDEEDEEEEDQEGSNSPKRQRCS